MPLRAEKLHQLASQDRAIVPLSPKARRKAIDNQNAARSLYEEARADILEHDLASFYRVAIFGSARLITSDPEYQFVADLTKSLVETRDVDIVTGGGPGVMEAALYGAEIAKQEALKNGQRRHALTHGVRISIESEQNTNEYVHVSSNHPEFSTRLQEFLDKTRAAYFAPGGIGTLLELAMVVQSKQVGHLEKEYLILAHPFWRSVVESWNSEMYSNRREAGLTPFVAQEDLGLVQFTDEVEEVCGLISGHYDQWHTEIRSRVRWLNPDRPVKVSMSDTSEYPKEIKIATGTNENISP